MKSNYKDLDVWIKAMELAVRSHKVFENNNNYAFNKLLDQIRKSAISVPSNIAESFGRHHKNDSLRFLHIARGSLYELETQMIIVNKLEIIGSKPFEDLQEKLLSCIKLLQGYIRYYKQTSFE